MAFEDVSGGARTADHASLKACADVDYRTEGAVAACLLFEHWTSPEPAGSIIEPVASLAPYEPGRFYHRELPCLLVPLRQVIACVGVVIVDGYVWLGAGRPGLGAHPYEALGRRAAVIGAAKTAFRGAPSIAVRRGRSQCPLHVTAAGTAPGAAARHVGEMHGDHRLPTLVAAGRSAFPRDRDPVVLTGTAGRQGLGRRCTRPAPRHNLPPVTCSRLPVTKELSASEARYT